jgi:hypothetical protein
MGKKWPPSIGGHFYYSYHTATAMDKMETIDNMSGIMPIFRI